MNFLSSFLKTYSIQAAGRTFSEKNVSRLKTAFIEIATLLIEAGVLDLKTLESLELELPKQELEVKAAMQENPTESFSTTVARSAWLASLEQCIQIFVSRFTRLHADSLEDLKEAYGDRVDRKFEIEKLINELTQYLVGLHHIYPPSPEDPIVNPAPAIAVPESDPAVAVVAEQPMQMSGIDLSFECPAIPVQAAAQILEAENRYPVRGVLFRVGEPSEATPAIGPGLPIYIPQEVALSVLESIAGIPLDCHDSLSQHAPRENMGVIMSAKIQGSDFVIDGYLHDCSQPEKVRLIQDQRDRLGMSMDASAVGYETELNGQKVFYVTRLKLKGATILFSDRATYRQTRLLPTSEETKTEVAEQVAIAAAAGELPLLDPQQQEQIPVIDTAQTSAQLTTISQSLESILQSLKVQDEKLNMHSQIIENLAAKMQAIEDEKEQQRMAIQAAAEQEKKQKEEQDLMSRLQALVDQGIKAAVTPNSHPRRQTTPLVAASSAIKPSSVSSEAYAIDLKLSRIEGEISASQHDLPKVIALTQEKMNLQAQRNAIA